MQRTNLLRRLALLAVIALLVAACGGDPAEVTEETEAAPSPTEAMTEEATEEATEATEEATEATEEATGDQAAPADCQDDGVLTLGSILPETGNLAFLGPPEFAAAELGVQDVNEAGGVLGEDVEYFEGDSGDTTTDIANQTVDRLLGQDVDAIIGAASSGVSFTVIDKITGAGVVHFSPANTSPDFTDYDDRGLYFRTAPSDVLQGRVLAQTILEDGHTSVGIMALQDPYGEGLLETTAQTLEESGATVTNRIVYNPQATSFDSEVQQLVQADPDAIVVIGFDESSRILSTMIEQGIGPENKGVYGTDGNMGNALGEAVQASIEGMRGTLPGSVASGEFQERLLEVDPDLIDYSYAGETYDAVIVTALAALVAESTCGEDLAAEIPDVTREGTECTSFEECAGLIEEGEDIDYNGQSGPIELNDVGDPTTANFQILEFNADNEVEVADTAEASLEE